MNPRLAVISLWAEDVPRAAHFYKDVIGLHLVSHHGDRPHFDLGNAYLVILKGKSQPAQNADPQRFPVLAFAVDDLEKSIEQLKAHQVDLPWGVEEDDDSRWVTFRDPAGNLIELAQFNHGQS